MSRLGGRLWRAWQAAHTIRARLTLWYIVLLALILVLFSGFLYVSLDRLLYSEVDHLLITEAREVGPTLEFHDGQAELPNGPRLLTAGLVVAVYDPGGELFATNAPHQMLPAPAEALARAVEGERSFDTVRLPDGVTWRVFTRPVAQSGSRVVVLQIARGVGDIERALSQLLIQTAVAVPLTLLLAIAGGLFLAGRALDPIARITRTADMIGAQGLSRRLRLPASPDEIGRLAATFDRMLDRLQAAFQRQRQFTADASHELRTPLALVMTEIDVTLERPREAREYREVLASVREQTARMSQLLNELLTLARADASQEIVDGEPIALDALADDVVAAMGPLADARGIQLERRAGPAVVVAGDQTRLTQLLVNLVENGLKYTPGGGRVTVSEGRDDGRATLTVADTGVGIAAEHLPHLFERFYRVDSARSRAAGGSGLGLSICDWIAQAHGGEIRVASEPGKGATFTVYLPLASRQPSPRDAGMAAPVGAASS